MIRYTLKCDQGHRFESWFQSADAYDGLAQKHLLSCSICGSSGVSKAIMSPKVASEAPIAPQAEPTQDLHEHLKKKVDYVGQDFAREARAIHKGESAERPIWGEATGGEVKSLLQDGVPVTPLPIVPPSKKN